MENNDISTDSSDFVSVLALRSKIQCLENELAEISSKVESLEELLLLAQDALSQCNCPALNDQISSLLSRVDWFMSSTATDHSTTSSAGCDGEFFFAWYISCVLATRIKPESAEISSYKMQKCMRKYLNRNLNPKPLTINPIFNSTEFAVSKT